MYLEYLKILGDMPQFLKKYLETPTLKRLKKISYFCGMYYASKEVYDFKEYISRFDHSLSIALLVYKFTKNKKQTIAALFHDIATPCFSHVIDYMNKDYAHQESTEEYTKVILENDFYLKKCLTFDNLKISDIANFKNYSLVDNNRPMVCADRLDGIILTGMIWTKDLTINDVLNIINDVTIFENEKGEKEFGFKTKMIAQKVLDVSDNIDIYCHSKEDNYMMELLANITKMGLDLKLFTYQDLYILTEDELFTILKASNNFELKSLLEKFGTIKSKDIEKIELPYIKIRSLNPLLNGKRLK